MPERETLFCADAAVWAAWLEAHHDDTDGVRLAIAKKHGTGSSPSYPEALDVALCWGWIDGIAHRLDEDYSLRTFTPRRSRSLWSQRNREHVERLTAAGLMRAPGAAEVERAKADGRWDAAYAGSRAMTVPDDLRVALAASAAAAAAFAALDASTRYAILFRIATVKRTATRSRIIAETVSTLRGDPDA